MTFNWPTFDQAVYRILRLHRLVVLAIAMPMIVILTVAWFDPVVLSPAHATVASLGLAALVIGHIVLFPNATLETIALSMSTAALIIVMPLLKLLSQWAPAEQASGAFVILVCFAVAVTGVLMALTTLALNALLNFGPVWVKTLTSSISLSCSPQVAFTQFAMRPEIRRGRVLTGEEDENGFFDVAVAVGLPNGVSEADATSIVKLDAKVLSSSPEQHDVMMVLNNGSVTVTSLRFKKTATGCEVHVSDLPNDFTVGMHALFWLTDQQADNLVETADHLNGATVRANSAAHHASVLAVAGALLAPRAPVAQEAQRD